MADDENGRYVCVHCGNNVVRLYKKYSPTVLKLCDCDHCGNVADKYLEYDKIIVLIDLILLSKEAYRHVLFNLQYKNYLKLTFLLLIIISFDECFYGKNTLKFQEGDFYESRFYIVCLATLLGKLLFLFLILISLNGYNFHNNRENLSLASIVTIWKSLICSSFGYFLLLAILIWDDQREIHIIFIQVYTLLSQIQALTVSTQVPRSILSVVCIFANIADQLFSSFLRTSLGV